MPSGGGGTPYFCSCSKAYGLSRSSESRAGICYLFSKNMSHENGMSDLNFGASFRSIFPVNTA